MPLVPFVEAVWYFEGAFEHELERMVPHPRMQLLVNLADDELRSYRGRRFEQVARTRGAAISGVHDRWFGIDTEQQRCIVGVTFRPGGAYPFFGVPASTLRNGHVDLSDLWRAEGAFVRERLLALATPEGKLDALQSLLLAHAVHPLSSDRTLVRAMSEIESGAPIRAVADHVGTTVRTLERRFQSKVGVSPKMFARLRRFQRLLASMKPGKAGWSELALAHGYYDQSHLHRDFVSFTGFAPSRYRAREADAINHIAMQRRSDTSSLSD